MQFGSKAALGAAAMVGVLAFGTSAQAYLSTFTVGAEAKCTSAKIKTVGKAAAGYTGCHSKGAAGSVATDPLCTGKSSTKLTSAFAKLDLKPPCYTTGDGGARDGDTATYALGVDTAVGHAGKCDAAKQKLVGKYVAGLMGCYAKAAAKAPGVVSNGPGSCTDKALVKLNAGIAKAELKPPCTTTGNAAALVTAADNYMLAQACALAAPGNPGCAPGPCGNGVVDVGEDCDTVGGAATSCQNVSNTGAAFTCTPVTCQCACPSTVQFTGTASDPASILDTGWTGFGHRAPIVSNGDTTINISGCSGSSRPCGTCTISGPAPNGPGKLENRRCSNATETRCTSNANCSGGGTCEYFFGTNLPLAAGGVTTCVVNQFNGSVSGTANIESGEASTTAFLTSSVYLGIVIDNPCPRCIGDATINDGVLGGTCSGGDRNGLTCDGNGTVFNRPDFGTTSLDCPPAGPASPIAKLPINLSNATDPVTKTLTATSPTCGDGSGERCLCDTCNSPGAETCDDNGDCADPPGPIGPVCGGKRCIAGANAGQACTTNSECPSSQCNRKGEPSKPSACLDDTSTVGILDCDDTLPVDGEGECSQGPITSNCSVASTHAQRGCAVDADCGGGIGSCESANRKCFLTGGFTGKVGTNTLVAVGMEDTPMNDTSNPTLGAVFCVGATNSDSVNTAAGLPGPGRVTIKGAAVGSP